MAGALILMFVCVFRWCGQESGLWCLHLRCCTRSGSWSRRFEATRSRTRRSSCASSWTKSNTSWSEPELSHQPPCRPIRDAWSNRCSAWSIPSFTASYSARWGPHTHTHILLECVRYTLNRIYLCLAHFLGKVFGVWSPLEHGGALLGSVVRVSRALPQQQ